MYSAPRRFVQTFLQVTEQVWQPMHLSRFITIADLGPDPHQYSTSLRRLRTTVSSSRCGPVGP